MDARAHSSEPPGGQRLSRAIADALGGGAPRVIWTDGTDEVLVHLDALEVDARDGVLVVVVDLEADDLPRERVSLSFALGERASSPGELVATTTARVDGGVLATRWGAIAQDAVFAALESVRRAPRPAAELDAHIARPGRHA